MREPGSERWPLDCQPGVVPITKAHLSFRAGSSPVGRKSIAQCFNPISVVGTGNARGPRASLGGPPKLSEHILGPHFGDRNFAGRGIRRAAENSTPAACAPRLTGLRPAPISEFGFKAGTALPAGASPVRDDSTVVGPPALCRPGRDWFPARCPTPAWKRWAMFCRPAGLETAGQEAKMTLASRAHRSCLPPPISPDKSPTTLNHGVAKARSAGFQPAVAQIFNLRIAPTAHGLPNEIRRYGRLKTCATSLRIRIAPESLCFIRVSTRLQPGEVRDLAGPAVSTASARETPPNR